MIYRIKNSMALDYMKKISKVCEHDWEMLLTLKYLQAPGNSHYTPDLCYSMNQQRIWERKIYICMRDMSLTSSSQT